MVLSVDMIQLKTSVFIFYSFHDLSSTISYWFEKYVSLLAYTVIMKTDAMRQMEGYTNRMNFTECSQP